MTSALIVDDDPFSREVAKQCLEECGFTDLAFACDGVEAIDYLRVLTKLPDVILLDLFMANKDGLEVIADLQQMEYKGALILISGDSGQFLEIGSLMACRSNLKLCGAITKPLRTDQLQRALALVDTYQAYDI